ncbi:hypothetical protein B0H10DRAFT_2244470 [Mycena sp. CBHHK59/15]|nr:hypothetical protein B0H10DRAFT_2244470 [Mycena sp. CBHHK59/15]
MSSQPYKPYHGFAQTTVDALRLVHAAHAGVIPCLTRRLSAVECLVFVKSGVVFIYGVKESSIERWNDNKKWMRKQGTSNFVVHPKYLNRMYLELSCRFIKNQPCQDSTLACASYKGTQQPTFVY